MTSVINFPFDGRDIVFEDFSDLKPTTVIVNSFTGESAPVLQGEGFYLRFAPQDTTFHGLDTQGRLVFEGVTRRLDDWPAVSDKNILPARRATRGSVGFKLELDINQFSLGKKYSLGIKLQAEVAPGEPDHYEPPNTSFGDVVPSTANLMLSYISIYGEDRKATNVFGGHLTRNLVFANGPVTTQDNATFFLDASIESSSEFIDIREDFTDKNLIVMIGLEGRLMGFKRIILTKREATP